MRTSADCLFCRVVAGDIPSTRVYEDETVVAFRDIHPQAPTHVLIVPREHIPVVHDLTDDDLAISGALLLAAGRIAKELGLTERGYRVVTNAGEWGGQTVFHLHFHLLGGRALGALG